MPKEKKTKAVFDRREAKASPKSWKQGVRASQAVLPKKGPK